MNKAKFIYTKLALVSLASLLVYQNCGLNLIAFQTAFPLTGHEFLSESTFQKTSYSTQLGDREYVYSVLENVFYQTGLDESQMSTSHRRVRELVLFRPIEFGGNCLTHDDESTCQNQSRTIYLKTAKFNPDVQSLREGYKTQACDVAALDDAAIRNALSKVGLNENSDHNDANLQRAHSLFYPARSPASAEVDGLRGVGDHALSLGDTLDKWRFIILSVCYSSGWQVI